MLASILDKVWRRAATTPEGEDHPLPTPVPVPPTLDGQDGDGREGLYP